MSVTITAPVKVKATPYKYAWQAGPDGRTLDLGSLTARVWMMAGLWYSEVMVEGKRYLGTRPTLEAAFKDVDRLIYRFRPECMWVTDCTVMTESWKGEIPEC